MSSHYSEQRVLRTSESTLRDVARHLYTRQFCGPIVVVVDRPSIALSTVKKQWHTVERRAIRERSSTLMATRIAELSNAVSHMQHTRFVAGLQGGVVARQNILFATAEEFLAKTSSCGTLYVACPASDAKLTALSQSVNKHGVVVTYP